MSGTTTQQGIKLADREVQALAEGDTLLGVILQTVDGVRRVRRVALTDPMLIRALGAQSVTVVTLSDGTKSGNWPIPYAAAVVPDVWCQAVNAGGVVTFDVTSATAAGFAIKAYKIAAVLGVLGISNPAAVTVKVFAKAPS